MADYYADSSVLVKRHVNEVGSGSVRALADPTTRNVIITSQVSIIRELVPGNEWGNSSQSRCRPQTDVRHQ